MNFTSAEAPDQTGKTFLITGANIGIAFEAVKVFAEKGATVFLGCRDPEKGQRAVADIVAANPGAADTELAATVEGVEGGQYFGSGGENECSGPAKMVEPLPVCKDPVRDKRLWELSIAMTGVDPGI